MSRSFPSLAGFLAIALAAGLAQQVAAQNTTESEDANRRASTEADDADSRETAEDSESEDAEQARRQSRQSTLRQQQDGTTSDRRQMETEQMDNELEDNRPFEDRFDRRYDPRFEQRSDRQNYQFDEQFDQQLDQRAQRFDRRDFDPRDQEFSTRQRDRLQSRQDEFTYDRQQVQSQQEQRQLAQRQLNQRIDLGADIATGANDQLIVREVTGGLAQSIGLRENDVLVSVAGREVASVDQVESVIYRTDLANVQRIPVVIVRDGRRTVLYVEPDMLSYAPYPPDRDYYAGRNAWLGVTLDGRYQDSAVVQNVVPDSPADHAGVRRGDMIVRLNGHRVASPGHLTRLIDRMDPGQEAEIEVVRRVSGRLYAQLEGEPVYERRQAARPVYEGYQEERVYRYEQPRSVPAGQQPYQRGQAVETFEPDQNRGVLNRLGPGEQGLRDRLDRDELPNRPLMQRR